MCVLGGGVVYVLLERGVCEGLEKGGRKEGREGGREKQHVSADGTDSVKPSSHRPYSAESSHPKTTDSFKATPAALVSWLSSVEEASLSLSPDDV